MADFDKLSFEVEAKDSASSVLQNIVSTLEKIKTLQNEIKRGANGKIIGGVSGVGSNRKPKSQLTRDFRIWSQTGNITKPIMRRATQQGNLDVYNYAKRNISLATSLGNANYVATRREILRLQQQKKEIDNQLKVELGIKKTTSQTKLNTKANQENAKSFASVATKVATVIALARKAGQYLASATKESGAYIENLNLFAVTFGKTYEKTAKWAIDIANNLGVSINEIIKFTGLFKQLSTAIGVAENTGTKMAETLTKLGYDFASFYNIDITSAMEKLQAGIYSGQTKPLRSIGIDVTYQSIDNLLRTNEALAVFNTSSKKLDQSQKAIARLIIAMQSGSNAFGDMSNTVNTLANQIRVLQGGLSNFKLALGDLVNEPIRVTLVYINALILAMTNVIRLFKPINTRSATGESQIATLGADAEETNEAIEELNGKLATFDKFNVLNSSGDTGTSNITDVLTQELEKQIAIYDQIWDSQNKIKNNAVVMANKITQSVENILISLGAYREEENGVLKLSNGLELAVSGLASVFGVLLAQLDVAIITKFMSKFGDFGKVFSIKRLGISALISALVYMYNTNEKFRDSVNRLLDAVLKLIGNGLDKLSKPIMTTVDILSKWLDILAPILSYILDMASSLLEVADSGNALIPILIIIGSLISLKKLLGVSGVISNISANILPLVAGIALLVGGIQSFISVADKMTSLEKIVSIIVALTSAVIGFVVALKALSLSVPVALGVGASLAGGILLLSSSIKKQQIQGFANGGITNANLIMTHENGVREWVGRQGSSTAVVNDSQMSDVMEQAVARGVYRALSSARQVESSSNNGSHTTKIYINGREILTAVENEASKQGKKFANI